MATVHLVAVAAAAGIAIGFVGGLFRLLLGVAGDGRADALSWAHRCPWIGWLAPVTLAAVAAGLARLAVRYVPEAMGSGIQNVEAAYRSEMPTPGWAVIPAKFVGGLLAIGVGGLALGREGPTVHMGAAFGARFGRLTGLGDDDCRVLQAAMGGAGLGVAFNAPLGGALFSFEEVAKGFTARLTLVTLVGSAAALASARVVVGDSPDFAVGSIATPAPWTAVLFVMFGALTGLLGAIYNRLVLACLDAATWAGRYARLGPGVLAAAIGAVIGVVVWEQPLAVGGGDPLVGRVLDGRETDAALVAYLVVRTVVATVSYAAGTPGGLFAPLLAVGAVWGALCQGPVARWLPASADAHGAMAVVGMTALFAAVVRAPVTGVALLVEMTATTSLLVPMLAASFAAVAVATLVGSPPIYDSLRERIDPALRHRSPPGSATPGVTS